MADQRTMAELLRAPTEGYAEAIVVPPILVEHFELKHSLINMMTSDQFFRLEKDNPHEHIRWFNKINSIIKYKDVPNHVIKLMLFPFALAGAARRWLEKEPPMFDESFHEAWDRYKDLLRACPHHGFIELHQQDTFYNALNPSDQDSLNFVAGGNLLERSYGNSSSSDIAKLTHAVNQQTSDVTTAMTAILKQFQATPPPASVKAVEEICVTCGGPHPYFQCLTAMATLSRSIGIIFKDTLQQPRVTTIRVMPIIVLQVWLIKQDHRVLFNKTGKITKIVLTNLKDIIEVTISIKIQLIKL
ncbi:hypothetical protein Tco_1560349 [Tanacetum coccineum]